MSILRNCDPSDSAAVLYAVGFCKALKEHDDKEFLDRYVQSDTGQLPGSVLSLQVAFPRIYYAVSRGDAVLVLNCIQNADQGVALWDGYANILTTQVAEARNGWFDAWCDLIDSVVRPPLLPPTTTLNIYGFSAGGACAVVYADRMRQRGFRGNISIITFGAPKPGNRAMRDRIASPFITRWMTQDDPVPNIPPPAAALHLFGPLYTLAQLSKVYAFVQAPSGLVISQTGGLTRQDLPTQSPQNYALSFGAWIWSQVTNDNTSHSIDAYLTALNALYPPAIPATVPPPLVPQPTPAPAPTPAMIVAVSASGVQSIFNNQVARDLTAPVIPAASEFRAVRQGRIWVVTFRNNVVAVGPRRRTAQSLARKGNAFLAELLPQGIVDPTEIVNQFNAFIEDATDPASGITPTMQPRWPITP